MRFRSFRLCIPLCCRVLLACALSVPAAAGAAEIDVRELAYRNGDVEIPAWLYLPPGEGPHPAVLFLHGRRGWGEQADGQVRRIVSEGFAVLAPDFYTARFIETWPMEHDPEINRDAELALDFMRTIPDLRAERICVVGISRGGYIGILLAARRAEVACLVSYYGHTVDPNAPEPWQVYRYAPEVDAIEVPVLLIVGDEDFEVRRIGIRRVFYRLLQRGVPVELRVYPHARRAFDFRGDQREEELLATEDAARWAGALLTRVLAEKQHDAR
jgi:carboxymethylenebutenolidase